MIDPLIEYQHSEERSEVFGMPLAAISLVVGTVGAYPDEIATSSSGLLAMTVQKEEKGGGAVYERTSERNH